MSTILKAVLEKIDGEAEALCQCGMTIIQCANKRHFKQGAEYGYQLATDGREELEKENERLKKAEEHSIANFKNMTARLNNAHEEIESYKNVISSQDEEIEALKEGIKTKAWEGVLTQADQIAALQSSLKEKDQEIEWRVKNQFELEKKYASKIAELEELKAENEKLNRLVPDHNSTPFT